MNIIRQFLLSIQKFVATQIRTLVWICIITEVALLAAGFYIASNAAALYELYFFALYNVGSKLGVLSLFLYLATLLPSIITRLQLLPLITQPIASILSLLRRHLGILMFITAWLHMSLTTSLPQLVTNGFDPSKIELLLFHWMGEIAWWLLFPLWLTSNDLSKRFMGKWWKVLHRLTYIAMFFIFLHVAMQREALLLVIGAVVVLEVASWIVANKRSRSVQQPTSTSL